jgi:hypothetical protein
VNQKSLAIALFVFVTGLGAAGCKQGLGQRCQVDDDCSSGVCSMASPKVCVGKDDDMTMIDMLLPPDTGDAPAIDAQ